MNRRGFILAASAALIPLPAFATQDAGVIFVGASWCPVCKQAAPILALLAEQGQFPVLVASEDARPIAPFENVTPSMGHPIASQITKYPTTLVFSASKGGLVGMIEGFRNAKWYMRGVANLIVQVERGI